MSWVLFVILAVYVLTILFIIYGFTKVKNFQNPVAANTNPEPQTTFTIIVPFRNEIDNLPNLLQSFSKLKYPHDLFEVILVDDNSQEKIFVSSFPFHVSVIDTIRVSNSPKKDAISTAMQRVKTNWVITTDADCLVPENWLLTFDNYIQQHNVSMLAGAVTYQCEDLFLHDFQQLDLMSLQGATIGSFGLHNAFMCNGANFAYKKTLFESLNGFEGNDTIASGDDVFLLQKAAKSFPDKVHYLKAKEAIVVTKPTESWKSLFYQRVRWAAKTSSYQSNFGKALGLIVFFGNLNFVIGFFFFGFSIFSGSGNNWQALFLFVGLKFTVDFVLLFITNQFLTKSGIKSLWRSSLWYPFFSTSVALYSFFGPYEWKGRTFKS